MGSWTIAWTNPALLIGALGLLIPYLVHLLTKRTPRTLVFPTIQFLKRAKANQSAFFRLRDSILLIVRTAFVLLLLLAFLKPVLRARAMTGDEDKQQAAVIILDTSLSMQHNEAAPFARAKQAVEKLLSHLDGDCVTNVITVAASTKSSLEAPSSGIAPLRRDLLAAAPTLERADVDAALDEAVRQLQGFEDHARSIYIVSDFQRTNWSAAKFLAVPENIKLVFLPVNEASAANLAITDVAIRPRTPVLSESVEVVCTVANYGGTTAEIPVKLSMRRVATDPSANTDQADLSEKKLTIAPGSSAAASFRFRAASIGDFEGMATIAQDQLGADNTRYFTLRVDEQIDVILVSDVNGEARSSAYFTWRALDPFADDRDRHSPSTLRTEVVRARDLDLSAEAPQVLVIDGAGPLSERNITQIIEYVSNGGAVIYFLSDILDKGNLDTLALAAKDSVALPFSLSTLLDRQTGSGEAGTMAEVRMEDSIFRRFKDTGEISAMAFYRYFETERAQGRGEVLARYADGNLAMGKATLGAGAMLLCNFSAARAASDLAQKPAFIPLVHEMVKSMRPREGAAAKAVVGYPASGAVRLAANAQSVMFLSPSGKNVNATTERRGESMAVILPATQEFGFYRVNEGSSHVGSIPVNVDARESDLIALSEKQLEELAAAPQRKTVSTTARTARNIGALMEGVPVWPYLLLAALSLLGIEQFMLFALKR